MRPRIVQIEVEEWGPVREARLELGSLTVLIGPQNSGKTYLALLSTLLLKMAEDIKRHIILESALELLRREHGPGHYSSDTVLDFVEKRATEIAELTREKASLYCPSLFSHTIQQYYLLRPRELIRAGGASASLSITVSHAEGGSMTLHAKVGKEEGDVSVRADVSEQFVCELVRAAKPEVMLHEHGGWSASYRRGLFVHDAFYIPAERLFLLPMLTDILNITIEIYRRLRGSIGIETIKQPVIDYLERLNTAIRSSGKELRRFNIFELGDAVIEEGRISFEDALHKVKVPIASAGSGIAQLIGVLAPLSFYRKGFVVIEEPEINLHVDAQLRVAELLASVASERQVLITTHSHYLLAKLANLYAKRDAIESLKAYFLDPEDGVVKGLDLSRAGDVEMPESIRRAIEYLAAESLELVKSFYKFK